MLLILEMGWDEYFLYLTGMAGRTPGLANHAQNVLLTHDDVFLAVDGHIGTGILGKQDTITHLHIHGDYLPTTGEVQKAKDCTIGFLNQDLLSYQSDDSILDVALAASDVVEESDNLRGSE